MLKSLFVITSSNNKTELVLISLKHIDGKKKQISVTKSLRASV